jgi:hypothetical protein
MKSPTLQIRQLWSRPLIAGLPVQRPEAVFLLLSPTAGLKRGGSGFEVQGSRSRVHGSCFMSCAIFLVLSPTAGLRLWGSGFSVQASRARVYGSCFMSCAVFLVLSPTAELRLWGSGFSVQASQSRSMSCATALRPRAIEVFG